MPFSVRLAQEHEIADLATIEVEARSRFSDVEMTAELREYRTPERELQACRRQGLLWVAEVQGFGIAGFLTAEPLEEGLHVLQMSVLPSLGRGGIGSRLLAQAEQEAQDRGLKHLTLTTFDHIPWNAPAYLKLGFAALALHEITPALQECLQNEGAAGLSNRVAMRKSALKKLLPSS